MNRTDARGTCWSRLNPNVPPVRTGAPPQWCFMMNSGTAATCLYRASLEAEKRFLFDAFVLFRGRDPPPWLCRTHQHTRVICALTSLSTGPRRSDSRNARLCTIRVSTTRRKDCQPPEKQAGVALFLNGGVSGRRCLLDVGPFKLGCFWHGQVGSRGQHKVYPRLAARVLSACLPHMWFRACEYTLLIVCA